MESNAKSQTNAEAMEQVIQRIRLEVETLRKERLDALDCQTFVGITETESWENEKRLARLKQLTEELERLQKAG